MEFIQQLYSKAKKLKKAIVLPETDDIRILKAASIILTSKITQIILIGDENKIQALAEKENIKLNGAQIINPQASKEIDLLAQKYAERNQKKAISFEQAKRTLLDDPVFFGAMLVEINQADGLVSGADHATAHTIKAAVRCVGVAKNYQLISSYFIMLLNDREIGVNGMLLYADCGVIPNPNAEELAEIAACSADSFRQLVPTTPKIAMLSFSTKGSAQHPDVEKVVKATEILKSKKPELIVDGELQLDAALVPEVARKKAKNSPLAGSANILIFPDLDAGNIGYKLTQRLAGAIALGPIFQGVAKPINDLSRGCSVEDIVQIVAITAIQAG